MPAQREWNHGSTYTSNKQPCCSCPSYQQPVDDKHDNSNNGVSEGIQKCWKGIANKATKVLKGRNPTCANISASDTTRFEIDRASFLNRCFGYTRTSNRFVPYSKQQPKSSVLNSTSQIWDVEFSTLVFPAFARIHLLAAFVAVSRWISTLFAV